MGSCPMGGPRRTAHDRSRAPRAGPPSKTAFGGTNHHHGPCEPSLRSLRTGLRRGGAKIPEIRKHPPETGPQNRPENRVNTPPEGSRDSFRQRKPLTLRRFHKNRRKSSQGRNAWLTSQSAANRSAGQIPGNRENTGNFPKKWLRRTESKGIYRSKISTLFD